MTFSDDLDKFSVAIGYKSPVDLALRLIIPIFLTGTFLGVAFAFIPAIPIFLSVVMFVLGVIVACAIPFIKYQMIKSDIENHIHYFITYAGTLATMNISHYVLFRRVSEKKVFGKISETFERISFLAKDWNFGFAAACRHLSKRTPSTILGDFLDRFAIMLNFGEDLQLFLFEEQESVLEDYALSYKKSLENIKLLQEIFMALSISFGFVLSLILLGTMLIDVDVSIALIWSFVVVFVIDIALIVIVTSTIPRDNLFSELPEKNLVQRQLKYYFFACLAASLVLFVLLLLIFPKWNLLLQLAIASGPLVVVAMKASEEEEAVMRRDNQFPSFVRVLGSAIEVRSGAVASAIRIIQMHDFGKLNDMIENLYRRLRIGSDKFRSWYYFAVESGSNLIANFSKIFSESVYLGGRSEKIGEVVSKNLLQLLSLRKLRQQLAGSLRGSIYGTFLGVVATVFVSVGISEFLVTLFGKDLVDGTAVSSFVSTILPSIDVNFGQVTLIISLLLAFHALMTSIMLKLVDGGSMYGCLFDFIILLWIMALLQLAVPALVNMILPQPDTLLSIN